MVINIIFLAIIRILPYTNCDKILVDSEAGITFCVCEHSMRFMAPDVELNVP